MRERKTLLIALAGVMAALAFASEAAADGCFVWRKGADLYEPSQKAIILHKDGVEDMILQVKYSGEAQDFCWIVPLPAAPVLSPVDRDVFAEVSLYTQQRWKWGYRQAAEATVEVLSEKKVGIFDTAVLKASDPVELQRWLEKRGFAFPEGRTDVLAHYARKQWVFAAVRIHPDELGEDVAKKLREGTIQPLLFTFDSKEIVFPLHISSVNAGETEVLLYVLADHPVSHPWFRTENAPSWAEDVNWGEYGANVKRHFTEKWRDEWFYRRITKDELSECRATLKRMGDARFHLTRLQGKFCRALMTDDVVLAPSPGAKAQREARRPFAARLRLAGGIFMGISVPDLRLGEDRWFFDERYRELHAAFGASQTDPGIREAWAEMDKMQATGTDQGLYDRLDAGERVGLLRSALTFHRMAVADRAAAKDPDAATFFCREMDRNAMAVCCKLLGKPVPEYRSWADFQKLWPDIETDAKRRETEGFAGK